MVPPNTGPLPGSGCLTHGDRTTPSEAGISTSGGIFRDLVHSDGSLRSSRQSIFIFRPPIPVKRLVHAHRIWMAIYVSSQQEAGAQQCEQWKGTMPVAPEFGILPITYTSFSMSRHYAAHGIEWTPWKLFVLCQKVGLLSETLRMASLVSQEGDPTVAVMDETVSAVRNCSFAQSEPGDQEWGFFFICRTCYGAGSLPTEAVRLALMDPHRQ